MDGQRLMTIHLVKVGAYHIRECLMWKEMKDLARFRIFAHSGDPCNPNLCCFVCFASQSVFSMLINNVSVDIQQQCFYKWLGIARRVTWITFFCKGLSWHIHLFLEVKFVFVLFCFLPLIGKLNLQTGYKLLSGDLHIFLSQRVKLLLSPTRLL